MYTYGLLIQNTCTTRNKICGFYVVTLLNRTSEFEWYMARLVVKNGHYKNTCSDEIRLCA